MQDVPDFVNGSMKVFTNEELETIIEALETQGADMTTHREQKTFTEF